MSETSELSPDIEDDEFLYRGIHITQYAQDKITSATYKVQVGVSVDRQGGRNDEAAAKALTDRKDYRAVVKVLTSVARSFDVLVEYDPLDDNIFHCLLKGDKGRVKISSSKAKKLARNSVYVYNPNQA